jgi:capsular exopolysaccharide synthesis family protein
VTDKTIILPPNSATSGPDAAYRLTMMVPKRRYFSYLRERWWVVLLTLVFALTVTIGYETVRTPLFESFAQIYLVDSVHLDASSIFSDQNETYFGTQVQLLKSPTLENDAMQKAGIQVPLGEISPYKIDVTVPLKTSILVLQADGPDPDLTQHYLQYLVDGYLSYKKQTHISSSQDVLDSLRDELAGKAADLQAEEDKLANFERSNNVAVLEEEGKTDGQYLAQLNVDLAQYQLQAKLLGNQIEAETPPPAATTTLATGATTNGVTSTNVLTGSSATAPVTAFSPAVLPPTTNEVEATTDASLNSTRIQLAQFLANEQDEVRNMGQKGFDDEVARLRQTILILANQDRSERIAQFNELQNRIAGIQASIPSLEARVLDDNARLARSESLKENVAREQAYYDHLLSTLQNVDLNKNVQQEGLSVLQPATPPQPQKRYLAIRIIVAFILGVFLGLALVYGWYLLDDRFVSFHDITDQFGETLLALIPQIKIPRKQPAQALLAELDPRQTYLESYRHLRSALLLSSAESRPQILLFTSSTAAEGKTTVAVNLARLLARSGLRVALVDSDYQGEGLQRLMGEKEQPGVLDYLRGTAQASAVIYPTGCEGLFFVPAGTRQNQSEGLFLRPKLGDLLADLRRTHDFVIIDGPPILTSDDAAMLVPHADTVILVTRPFYSRSRHVRQTLDMLYQRQARNVNIVMNRARPDDLAGHQAMRGVTRRAVVLKS